MSSHFRIGVLRLGELTPDGCSGCSVLPPELVFPPCFIKIVVEVKTSGPPHVLRLWLGVSKVMLPVQYFCSNKASFVSVEFHGDRDTVTELR